MATFSKKPFCVDSRLLIFYACLHVLLGPVGAGPVDAHVTSEVDPDLLGSLTEATERLSGAYREGINHVAVPNICKYSYL